MDGGTDRWLSWLTEHGYDLKNMQPPHLVTGDMDSISKHVLQYYMTTNQTTQVLHTPDQIETDYTKAIRELQQFLSERNMVVGSFFYLFESVELITEYLDRVHFCDGRELRTFRSNYRKY